MYQTDRKCASINQSINLNKQKQLDSKIEIKNSFDLRHSKWIYHCIFWGRLQKRTSNCSNVIFWSSWSKMLVFMGKSKWDKNRNWTRIYRSYQKFLTAKAKSLILLLFVAEIDSCYTKIKTTRRWSLQLIDN